MKALQELMNMVIKTDDDLKSADSRLIKDSEREQGGSGRMHTYSFLLGGALAALIWLIGGLAFAYIRLLDIASFIETLAGQWVYMLLIFFSVFAIWVTFSLVKILQEVNRFATKYSYLLSHYLGRASFHRFFIIVVLILMVIGGLVAASGAMPQV